MQQASWNPAAYDDRHGFVSAFGESLVDILDPKPGERFVDLGCGTGDLTHQIAERGASIVGIDSSPEMIDSARSKYPHIEFHVADGHTFEIGTGFDGAFSNAALHWMTTPREVVRRVAAAVRSGGRFVGELGGHGNIESIQLAIERSLRDVGILAELATVRRWYFPKLGEYAQLLESEGFDVLDAHLFDRPTPLAVGEDGLREWMRMFHATLVSGIPSHLLESVIVQVENDLRPTHWDGTRWTADYRRLRFAARRA